MLSRPFIAFPSPKEPRSFVNGGGVGPHFRERLPSGWARSRKVRFLGTEQALNGRRARRCGSIPGIAGPVPARAAAADY